MTIASGAVFARANGQGGHDSLGSSPGELTRRRASTMQAETTTQRLPTMPALRSNSLATGAGHLSSASPRCAGMEDARSGDGVVIARPKR
jgi:hypothetical protein